MTVTTKLTAAALTASASLAMTVTPAGAAVIGAPVGPGNATCSTPARLAVAQAYAKTRTKANSASLRVAETDAKAGKAMWTSVVDLDATTGTLRMRHHNGGANMAGLDSTQTGTGAGPYTLTQRIGGGNMFTFGYPEQTVTQANDQAWALAKLLKHENLGAISYTIPKDAAEVANGAALLAAPLDRSIRGDRHASLCLSAAKQKDGTTVYSTIKGPGRTYVTDASGTLIRVSVATTYWGAPGRYSFNISWATPVIPAFPAGTVRAMDADVDTAANIILLRTVATALAAEIGYTASQNAMELHRALSVAELRAVAATFSKETGSRYRLGDMFAVDPAPGPIELHLFGNGGYSHPYTVTHITGGIKVEVAAGMSRAGYALTATPTGVKTSALIYALR